MFPQIIMIILMSLGLLSSLALAGQRMGRFNIFTTTLSGAMSVALLTWGGFFATIGTPQILYITLYALSFIMVGLLHGKRPNTRRSALSGVINYAVIVGLQYWGGFYDSMI